MSKTVHALHCLRMLFAQHSHNVVSSPQRLTLTLTPTSAILDHLSCPTVHALSLPTSPHPPLFAYFHTSRSYRERARAACCVLLSTFARELRFAGMSAESNCTRRIPSACASPAYRPLITNAIPCQTCSSPQASPAILESSSTPPTSLALFVFGRP